MDFQKQVVSIDSAQTDADLVSQCIVGRFKYLALDFLSPSSEARGISMLCFKNTLVKLAIHYSDALPLLREIVQYVQDFSSSYAHV